MKSLLKTALASSLALGLSGCCMLYDCGDAIRRGIDREYRMQSHQPRMFEDVDIMENNLANTANSDNCIVLWQNSQDGKFCTKYYINNRIYRKSSNGLLISEKYVYSVTPSQEPRYRLEK